METPASYSQNLYLAPLTGWESLRVHIFWINTKKKPQFSRHDARSRWWILENDTWVREERIPETPWATKCSLPCSILQHVWIPIWHPTSWKWQSLSLSFFLSFSLVWCWPQWHQLASRLNLMLPQAPWLHLIATPGTLSTAQWGLYST